MIQLPPRSPLFPYTTLFRSLIRDLIKDLVEINTSQHFTLPPLPRIDKAIVYHRKCYEYIRDFILRDESYVRYYITGNPGIGKTYFGRLMLVELLKQGKQVLRSEERRVGKE